MNKPYDYDTTQAYTGQAPLPPGGYVCRVMQVLETTAKSSGAPMLKISLDIAEGEYKDRFAGLYRADTSSDRKWKCVANQLVYDPNNTNSTNKGFKSFTTSVEKSNQGFVIQWGDRFAECFKNKLVGVVFRREQYVSDYDNSLQFSTKPAFFRSVEDIRNGVPVPADKLIDGTTQPYSPQASPAPHPTQTASAPQQNAPAPDVSFGDLSDFEEVIGNVKLPF